MVEDDTHQAERLAELTATIDSHVDWWRFPQEPPVQGFLGSDPVFLVGDQPSTSSWEYSNPNRRAFYDLLKRLGAANAHLTDLYKRRGRSGSLRSGLPPDFSTHLTFFREELAVVRPERVVALGQHAYDLLATHVPEVRPLLSQMWHFAYAVRYNLVTEWEKNAYFALHGPLAAFPMKPRSAVESASRVVSHNRTGSATTSRPRSQRAVMRELFRKYAGDTERTVSEYASAERAGEAPRSSNKAGLAPEVYARALLNDGMKKGWL